ncbi:MAG: lipoprotein 17-related variable surface protein [Metamycoplasmataceae bacterium]
MKKNFLLTLGVLTTAVLIAPAFISSKCSDDKNKPNIPTPTPTPNPEKPNLTDEQKETIFKAMASEIFKVKADVENKANVTADSIKTKDLKFSGYDANTYEIIVKDISVDKIDSTKLKTVINIKHKTSGLFSKKERTITISDFKKKEVTNPEEKAFNEFVENIKGKYEGGDLTKLDVNELDISKVKLTDKEDKTISSEYQISDLKFENETPKEEEYNSGKRKVTFTVKKGTFTKVWRIELQCHQTSYTAIIQQREKIVKNWKFANTSKAEEVLKTLSDEQTLFYDFKTKAIYDKKYNDASRTQLFKYEGGDLAYGTSLYDVKFVKKADGKYAFKFILGFYNKDKTGKITEKKDLKELTTEDIIANEVITQEKLDAYADTIKSQISYKDASNVELSKVKQEDVKLPNNPTYPITITKFVKDLPNKKLLVSYVVKSGSLTSKEVTTEITGFKENDLSSIFGKLKIDYENKNNVLPSQAEENKFKLLDKDNNSEYTFNGITVNKTITEKNDLTGVLKLKVTLTKGSESEEYEYTVDGFKKNAVTLDSLKSKVKTTLDKETTLKQDLASNVKDENIKWNGLTDQEKELVELKVFKLEADDKNGKLTVTTEITLKSTNEKATITATFEGFKKQTAQDETPSDIKSPEIWKASVEGKLLKITETDKSKLKEAIKKFLSGNDKNKILAVVGGSLKMGKKSGNDFPGVEIADEYKSIANTHGKQANIANGSGTYNNNTKGLTIVEKNGKYYFAWRCLKKDGKTPYDRTFEQEICESK